MTSHSRPQGLIHATQVKSLFRRCLGASSCFPAGHVPRSTFQSFQGVSCTLPNCYGPPDWAAGTRSRGSHAYTQPHHDVPNLHAWSQHGQGIGLRTRPTRLDGRFVFAGGVSPQLARGMSPTFELGTNPGSFMWRLPWLLSLVRGSTLPRLWRQVCTSHDSLATCQDIGCYLRG